VWGRARGGGRKSEGAKPYLLVYFKAIEAKRAAMRELGFTPAPRVGLPTDDSRDADPEDERWQWLVELSEKNKAERARLAKRKKNKREIPLATPPFTPEAQ
jgi:hypothetical protein